MLLLHKNLRKINFYLYSCDSSSLLRDCIQDFSGFASAGLPTPVAGTSQHGPTDVWPKHSQSS
jgi:hypothetical protein